MATKKNKDITLAEFKAWLEGVEELQAKDWAPDKTQWKRIRSKINCIVEPEPRYVEAAPEAASPAPRYAPNPPAGVPPSPGTMPAGVPQLPSGGSSLPDIADIDISPAAKKLLGPSSTTAPTKTPDIESDPDGRVESPFA